VQLTTRFELGERLGALPCGETVVAAAHDVEAVAGRHRPMPANVDLAIAALTIVNGMPARTGETIFAVARTVGWIAYALEEYAETALRMRPSGLYRGPRPPQPLPW
jgi:citrate synthase